jgi:hypothetical protein
MLKKTIRYTDYNGKDVQEDFYFNLTKAELVELEAGTKGGLAESLQAIIDSGDNHEIIEHFKRIILASYGVKSEDGRRFIKTQELRDEFSQMEAYSELFIELATVNSAAVEFISGVVPASLSQEVARSVADSDEAPAIKDPTQMTREELLEAYQKKGEVA